MAGHDKYRKYQVYFFLYLAVVCELLIVIVERDEAEEVSQRQKQELIQKNSDMIKELVKLLPKFSPTDEITYLREEPKTIDIILMGLGEDDEVGNPPKIEIRRRNDFGEPMQVFSETIISPQDLSAGTIQQGKQDILYLHHAGKYVTDIRLAGYNHYKFRWTPRVAKGEYEFKVVAGTNRIIVLPGGDSLKIGTLRFPMDEVETAVGGRDSLLAILDRSSSIDSKINVVVDDKALDKIKLSVPKEPIIVAEGFPVRIPIGVEGVASEKVAAIDVTNGVGRVQPGNPQKTEWVWQNTFTNVDTAKPLVTNVTLVGRDNRGDPTKSRSDAATFVVVAKKPVLDNKTGKFPTPYAGEPYTFDIRVQGLEDASQYKYKVFLDNESNLLVEGTGTSIKNLPLKEEYEGRNLVVNASYAGMPYKFYVKGKNKLDELNSQFTLLVKRPNAATFDQTFFDGGKFTEGTPLKFSVSRCAVCNNKNEKAIPESSIQLSVKSKDASVAITSRRIEKRMYDPKSHQGAYTEVSFVLKGKSIPPKGAKVDLQITIEGKEETYSFTLLPSK